MEMLRASKRTLIGITAGAAVAVGVAIAFVMGFATPNLNRVNNTEQTSNMEGYLVNDQIHGKSFAEWTTEWWKVLMATPASVNPANDDSGKYCGTGNVGPDVHMLFGTAGGQADRSCTIPYGKDILITPIVGDCTRLTDQLNNDGDLTQCAKNFMDPKWIAEAYVTINGIRVPDNYIVYVQSEPFDLVNADGAVFNLPAGSDRAVSAGYWFFWKSPPRGEYLVTQAGSINNPVDNYGWTTVVNWKLTIE